MRSASAPVGHASAQRLAAVRDQKQRTLLIGDLERARGLALETEARDPALTGELLAMLDAYRLGELEDLLAEAAHP